LKVVGNAFFAVPVIARALAGPAPQSSITTFSGSTPGVGGGGHPG